MKAKAKTIYNGGVKQSQILQNGQLIGQCEENGTLWDQKITFAFVQRGARSALTVVSPQATSTL